MMDFTETQIGKMLNEIKLAYLSGVHVIYIPTPDKELINVLFLGEEGSGVVVPRMRIDAKTVLACKDASERPEYDNYNWNLPFKDGRNNVLDQQHIPELFLFVGVHPSDNNSSSWMFPFISDNDNKKKRSITDCVLEILDYILNIKQVINKNTNGYVDPDLRKRLSRSLIIVNTPNEEPVPADIEPYAKTVRVPPLSDEEIRELILEDLTKHGILSNNVLLDKMIVEMRGFNPRKIKTTTRLLIYTGLIPAPKDENGKYMLGDITKYIRKEKEEQLKNVAGLKWEEVTEDTPEAIGMGNITKWLDGYVNVFSDIRQAERNHIDIPKGILITGIPGSGKSLMAKTVAKKLDLPLISLDMGAMQSSFHGESEQNMIRALKKAEELSPAVLWVDEIEKAFSGSSSDAGEGDSGVAKRLFGKFLTWMQEKKAACFVFATANDITRLPPELFRSERFDRKFYSFLPNLKECSEMLASQVKQANKKYVETLSKCTEEEKRYMAGRLFDLELENEGTWSGIIRKSCDLYEFYKHISFAEWSRVSEAELKQYPSLEPFKLAYGCRRLDNGFLAPQKIQIFTGADIAAILKEIKRQILIKNKKRTYDSKDIKFTLDDVKSISESVIQKHKSYGETNIKDIVSCYLNLQKNQFEPASESCLISLENYNEDKVRYEPENRSQGTEDYDPIVYRKLVAAINYYALKFYREGKK